MVDGEVVVGSEAGGEPLSKEEALKRFLARKAASAAAKEEERPTAKRATDEDKQQAYDDLKDAYIKLATSV